MGVILIFSGMPSGKTSSLRTNTRSPSAGLRSMFTSAKRLFHRLIPCTPPPKPRVVVDPVTARKLSSALILSKPKVPKARTDGLGGGGRRGGTVRRACADAGLPGGRAASGGTVGADGGGVGLSVTYLS